MFGRTRGSRIDPLMAMGWQLTIGAIAMAGIVLTLIGFHQVEKGMRPKSV